MEQFIQKMPKIELHAHLNGSISADCLLELGKQKYGNQSEYLAELCENFRVTAEGHGTLSDCFQKFGLAHALTSTKELLEQAVHFVIRDFRMDNVIYLELRTTPKTTEYMSKREYLENVIQAIHSAEQIYPDIKVKLLPSIDRSRGYVDAKETIEIVMSLLNDNKNIIKGLDLSGNPEKGTFKEYENILTIAKQSNLKLAIHCGEIENEHEISEILLFGMDRCGHGTFIKHNNLTELKLKRIPVECCLSSNIKCGTVKSFVDHHFMDLYSQNHPVVICTDDSGVFNTTLSNEFEILTKTFQLNKSDLLRLSLDAIEASFANSNEKSIAKQIVNEYFDISIENPSW